MRLRELASQVHQAERALSKAIAERFEPGMSVRVRWGKHATVVTVLYTSFDRVKVRNHRTGTEYWVHAHRLVEFDSW